jgi:putative DNA primase/helicase
MRGKYNTARTAEQEPGWRVLTEQDVLGPLQAVKGAGDCKWTAKCPAHEDDRRSLSICLDGGKWLFKCFAGCSFSEIIGRIGISAAECFPEDERRGREKKPIHKAAAKKAPIQEVKKAAKAPQKLGKFVCAYDYTDEAGALLYQNCRFEDPKDFRQRRPDGQGGWITPWGLGDVRRVIYRLPEVRLAMSLGAPIWITEGEKDADRLQSLGLTATTSGGATTWRPEFADLLQGADVVIVPDQDVSGRMYRDAVGSSLQGRAKRVRVVELPVEFRQKHGLDVSDWLDGGKRLADLLELEKQAAEWSPEKKTTGADAILARGGKLMEAPLTDYGNAERLAELAMDDDGEPLVRWCEARGQWLAWDGKAWRWDETGSVESLAKRTVRRLREVAEAMNRDGIADFALKSEALPRLRAMIELMRTEPGVPVSMDQLDADDWTLNCRNGVVDLRSGKLFPHSKDRLLTKMAEASLVPGASRTRWIEFLGYIMGGDQSRVDLLQRGIGASASGAPWQYLIFLYGSGANGKSVFLEVVSRILASYAGEAAQGLLLQKKNEAHPTEVADLMGKRFVTSEEMDQSSVLDEGRVKRLTSGRPIKARFMREDLFEFRPTHKLWFAVNHKPRVRGQDEGIWRRIKLVPFEVQIPPEKRRDFEEVVQGFLQERDGIFAWIVEGCLRWQKEGLGASEAVDAAHEQYRTSMDDFGQFLEDCVAIAPDATADFCRVRSSDLYGAYAKWCEEGGVRKPMSQTAFSLRMTERGFQSEKKGCVWWTGITLQSKREDAP